MITYFFQCACGCGQNSKDLRKEEYVRIAPKKWYSSKECVSKLGLNEKNAVVLAGGLVVPDSDF
jgi:hypothetical protein